MPFLTSTYIPPNASKKEALETLEKTLKEKNIDKEKHVIIGGDFNINSMKTSPESDILQSFIINNNLLSTITTATHWEIFEICGAYMKERLIFKIWEKVVLL